jgi:hypothetical protein
MIFAKSMMSKVKKVKNLDYRNKSYKEKISRDGFIKKIRTHKIRYVSIVKASKRRISINLS